MVAFASAPEPEALSGLPSSSPFGTDTAVALLEDDGALGGRFFFADRVGSGKQGGAAFTGYVADNETGLLYARNRMYSPTLGRFVSRDPAGYVDGFALYRAFFAPNGVDPLGLYDPDDPKYGGSGSDDDCCCKITLIIELPDPNAKRRLDRKGLGGHTGIGIGSDYYDFGPQPGEGSNVGGSIARPWWDQMIPGVNDASLQNILDNISGLSGNNKAYKVEILAQKDECDTVKKNWEERYKRMKADQSTYEFYHHNCTSVVCLSLGGLQSQPNPQNPQYTSPFPDFLTPNSLFGAMDSGQWKHSCGSKKGTPVKPEQINGPTP